jgi:pimeloyl-ACP methyl ester carboxylesterase
VANGVRLHVQRVAPRGALGGDAPCPAVVFIHGLGTDSLASFYLTLAAPASAAGVDVITYDLRGHGHSEQPATGYRVSDFVGDLAGLLDALRLAEPVHLVGNSFGGTVAFSYAVEHPQRVASVVMIESEPATEAWSCKLSSLLDRAAGHFAHPDALSWVTQHYGARTSRLARAAGSRLQATTMARDIPSGPLLGDDEIRSVGCPVMAIFGAESDLVEQGEMMQSLLPRCSTVIVPGHEHSVLVEAPRTVRDLLLPWIDEHHVTTQSHEGRRA